MFIVVDRDPIFKWEEDVIEDVSEDVMLINVNDVNSSLQILALSFSVLVQRSQTVKSSIHTKTMNPN